MSSVSDTQAPRITFLSFSTNSVDTSSTDQVITIRARITDDKAGNAGDGYTSSPSQISFKSPTGIQRVWAMLSDRERISGTSLDGTVEYRMKVPKLSEIGTWTVDSLLLVDQIGNSQFLRSDDLIKAGLPTSFRVTAGQSDTKAPTITSLSFSTNSIDTSNTDQFITIRARITDDKAGNAGDGYTSSPSQISFKSPTGIQRVWAMLSDRERISGTSLDGTVEYRMKVPKLSEIGTWTVDSLLLVDQIGNSQFLRSDDLIKIGLPASFRVTGAQAGTNDTSTVQGNTINIGGNNSGIANNDTLTNNGSINQFSNNGSVNTGTVVSNSNNGNTTNSNNNSGNTFTTNSNNGNIVNSNNGNTTNVVNNYYTIINSNVNSNNQTTNTNSGNIGSTIGSFNTQNTINQTYVSKNSSDYKIVRIANNRYGIKLPDSNTVDEITGQRYVPFADKAIDIQKDVKGVFDQVTGKETSDAKMFRLYNAAFARTPDADGLRFWINSYSSGAVDYKQVAQSFLSSPEFATKYGMNNSNNDFVNNLYRNILGRSPDSSGLQFWVGNLNQGINSRADVLGGFSESPENKNLFSQTTGFN